MSKAEVKEFIMKDFQNDSRITDQLLFDGKRLTLQGYILLKSILPKADYYSCCLDDIAHHCYVTFAFDDNNVSYNYDDSKERDIVREKIKPVIERLETVISDNDCYFISDVIDGERDSNSHNGNRSHNWQAHKRYYIIDIWVFSHAGDVMEFATNNDEKCKLFLETL